jgi:outer membrane protein TolC
MLKSQTPNVLLLAASVILSGCFVIHPPCVADKDTEHFRTLAVTPMTADHEANPPGHAPLSTHEPLLVDANTPPPAWDMTLDVAMRLALENARVLRDLGGSVLRSPNSAQTIHDAAIQATDPRFGMEGALAAFDAQIATRLNAQKNDRAFNNLFLGGGAFLFQQDLDVWESEISKTTATGASIALRQHVDYDANNATANVFPSAWNDNYEASVRQPLLQGGGVEFNRIAGPKGTPGQVNGVVIARINNDVSTAEFEIGLRDFVSNLENAYWDLYYAYRELDAKIAARDTALNTWRIIQANVQEGRGYSKLQEVQSLEQYYRFQEEVLDALGGRIVERTRTNNGSNGGTFRAVGGVHAAERRLRLWMGLPINDGRLIRPIDEPPKAKVAFDWTQLADEALARRPELRRQRAQVQRTNMELVAAQNFLLPKFDLLGKYRFRGFGQDWMGQTNPAQPFNNAVSSLLSGQFQEWELGFEYSMPLGFRREYAAVRAAQLRIAREQAILDEQERQAIHDLAAAFADVDRAFTMSQVANNRMAAAQDQYIRAKDAFFELGGKVSLELVLDGRVRLADAETDFHRARIDYAVALKNVHFEKGSLLEYNGAMLANSPFHPDGVQPKRLCPENAQLINYVMSQAPYQSTEPAGAEASPHLAPPPPSGDAPAGPAVPRQSEPEQLPGFDVENSTQRATHSEAPIIEDITFDDLKVESSGAGKR